MHVYIWRGTMCMSTANYDPERMQPMLHDTVHTCALILQIFKKNIYIYLRFVCNYLQIITQRMLPGRVGAHMCLAFRNIQICARLLCGCIAHHISHNRQDRRWCTFFGPVPLLVSKTLSFAPFWPFLAILSRNHALFGAPFTGLKSVVVPQN